LLDATMQPERVRSSQINPFAHANGTDFIGM